jgi:hypothetical protein
VVRAPAHGRRQARRRAKASIERIVGAAFDPLRHTLRSFDDTDRFF